MTHVYQWFSLPRVLTVRCPTCSRAASLHRLDESSRDGGSIRGRLTCRNCHHSSESFDASWPVSAFFLCDVRGHELWAWSEAHARAIRDYVQSTTRNRRTHPGFIVALMHLPEFFLLAKNRAATVKSLNKLLHATG
jgi:hypothetical protein